MTAQGSGQQKPVRQKVVCYVVRDGQLLVFRHLDQPWEQSGLQVPAGSIKSGETPEEAALREASEETGLSTLRLVGNGPPAWLNGPHRRSR